MRTTIAIVVSGLAAATLLTGCRPEPAPDTAAPSATAQATQATATADASGQPSGTSAASAPSGSASDASTDGEGTTGPGPGQPTIAAAAAMDEDAQRNIPAVLIGQRRTETGTVSGFTMGDYFYVNGTSGGREVTWSTSGARNSILPFLIAHRGQALQMDVETRRAWTYEAGGYNDEEVIVAVRAGGQDDAAWWATQQRDPTARRRWERAQECVLSGSSTPPEPDCVQYVGAQR